MYMRALECVQNAFRFYTYAIQQIEAFSMDHTAKAKILSLGGGLDPTIPLKTEHCLHAVAARMAQITIDVGRFKFLKIMNKI